MSLAIMLFQSPTVLKSICMRFMATNQQPHLSRGRKEMRRRMKQTLKGEVSFLNVVEAMFIHRFIVLY